jgi:hypothetical protein
MNIKNSVVCQRFSEERELLRLKFRMFVRLGWCKQMPAADPIIALSAGEV